MSKLVNINGMIKKALDNKYAVPHININNLKWAKAILEKAEEMKSPIILATSRNAIKSMGGMKTIVGMVNGLIEDLKITVPVALHLDHGSFELVQEAIKNGYTSVMYDGSHLPFKENYENTKKIMEITKYKNISVEAEVGALSKNEFNNIKDGTKSNIEEIKKMVSLGISVIAVGIGNIHGPYPKIWKTLDFELLELINETINIGIVLHGGSGIPTEQIKKSISLGISKININTELQLANAEAIIEYIKSKNTENIEIQYFKPQVLDNVGVQAMKRVVEKKILDFGSNNKG